MGSQQFCLKWNNHQTNLLNVFEQQLQNEAFVDVTLACEGLSLKAHKMVLSACSPYFQGLFLENPCKHPIVILNSIKYSDLKAIIDFMYKGEVNVSQEQLSALLKTAELLKVKGLAEVTNQTTQSLNTQTNETISSLRPNSPNSIPLTHNSTQSRNSSSPPPKRKKVRSSVASSAANSPQTPSSVTNSSILNQPKNMPSDPSTVALDIKSEPHVVPVVAELSQEEHSTNHDRHSDQNTDQPPDLILERSPEMIDDHSSLSNVTTDMAYDHASADFSGQDLSGPPDITPSVQAVPSTSGMQSSTQVSQTSPVSVWMFQSCTAKPRTFGKKTWTMSELFAAMQDVMTGKMSVLKAAKTYGIPKSSLHDYLTGRTGFRLKRCYNKCKKTHQCSDN